MKLKKLITSALILALSVTMAFSLTACLGGGNAKYTVTFDANGGTMPNNATTMEVTMGENYSLPIPTKTGFDFDGWKNQEQSVADSGTWSIESNVTLKASWNAKTTAVTLNVNGGTGASELELTATYGQVLTLPTLTKVGYNFAGWTLSGSAFNTANAWALEDATATLVANWTVKTTTVTLDVNGGTGADELELTATYGQVLTLPTLTKVGYNFAGWTLNGSAFNTANAWALEDATATLVANWTAKTTTVTLNVNGGTGADELELTATYGVVLNLPTLTKPGYNFAGWTLNGSAFNTANAWALEDATATLVATWTAKTTTVTLDVNGGTGADELELTATYGVVLNLPTVTKAGFKFVGWKLNGNAYDVSTAWTLEDATATLVATWTEKGTTVTLSLDGGSYDGDTTIVAIYGQVLTLKTPTKVGFNFAGWTLNDSAFNTANPWSLEDEAATLVANWTAKTYNIYVKNFNGNIVNQGNPLVVTFGGEFSLVQFIPSEDMQPINGKEMFFDGFRIEGTEIKITEFENLVVSQDLGYEDIILVRTYESEDKWI